MRHRHDHIRYGRLALRAGGILAAALGAGVLSVGIASAATITVNTSADEFDLVPNSTCSLREAIESANQDANFGGCNGTGAYGNDTIVFASSVTAVNLTLISGTGNDNNKYLDLDIGDTNPNFPNDLTIDGGPVGVIVQPGTLNWTDRIFDIVPLPGIQPGAVVLRNLTIQGGAAPSDETGGGSPCFNSGGGVRNLAGTNLTLERVVIQNNTMPMNGGGVCHQSAGVLLVVNSTIRNNAASAMMGGGIFATGPNATMLIQNSVIRDNTASRGGGGIYDATGSFTLENSQVLSNTVNGPNGIGGGIFIFDGPPKSILTSTVAYNRADGDGGGIYVQNPGGVQINGSTVLSNTAGAFLQNPGNGGGIWSNRRLTLNNTQVLSNAALVSGTVSSFTPPGGGGIYSAQNAQLTVTDGRVSSNLARKFTSGVIAGGGIWNGGSGTLSNVEVASNVADGAIPFVTAQGGGIFNGATLNVLSSSRIHFNRAEGAGAFGGGIYNADVFSAGGAQLTLQSSSVATNTAQGNPGFGFAQGGGVFNSSAPGDTASILSSEIRNNRADGGQGALGGGVSSLGVLTLTSATVISNAATSVMQMSIGGGVNTGGIVLITNTQILTNVAYQGGGWHNGAIGAQLLHSTVRFNRALPTSNAFDHGGGIYNMADGVRLQVVTVCDNQAADDGGGLHNAPSGVLTITASVVCANTAGAQGGGILNEGTLTGVNVTLSGNGAPSGGGLRAIGGTANLTHTTIASNTSGNGVSIGSGTVNVRATLLAYNAGGNCSGSLTDNGNSRSSDNTCSVSVSNSNPLLRPLALNGGSTLNHAPLPHSPALDAAGNCNAYGVFNDQRGVSRPQNTACDVGAVELQFWRAYPPIVRKE
ncbi:MAG: CSLREA domain-containing protein [Thermoflexales bacterium]|nr:CSLREA domain-containing protein [Thermoflexales bacterium]